MSDDESDAAIACLCAAVVLSMHELQQKKGKESVNGREF